MSDAAVKDLFVLVPGKDEAATIDGVLRRPQALGLQTITWSIERHEERDPGCRRQAPDYLRPLIRQFRHALVVFDREGCGAETLSREQLELDLEKRLAASGWDDRATVIVIEPELENWIWSRSPRVDDAMGWTGHQPPLREWLTQQGLLAASAAKPDRPKEAMQRAMAMVRKRRSSKVYSELASHVSFGQCVDPSFVKLKTMLQKWFSEAQ